MKDLIIITAYCDTTQKINVLRKLVENIKKQEVFFDTMVISHTTLPQDICENTNFCIYDSKNELLFDTNMRSTPWFNPDNQRRILSCYTGFFNVHLAIWRMLIIANSVAKNCGYNKVHHLEYDCYIEDFSELKENSVLLETYDAVTYTKEVENTDPILFGTYQSYNINKLPTDLLILDEKNLKKQIRESDDKSAERMLFDLLNWNKNVKIKNKTDLDKNGNSFGLSHVDHYNQNTAWCLPYFDQLTEKLGFVIWNFETPEKEIDVKLIYNNNTVIDFGTIKHKYWVLRDIDDFENAKTLLVLLNNKVRNFYDFENDGDEFKKVSYRKKE
jgi:hypothetical protein